jgi:multisubunit Na+/H+ antiporter MnhE subunit
MSDDEHCRPNAKAMVRMQKTETVIRLQRWASAREEIVRITYRGSKSTEQNIARIPTRSRRAWETCTLGVSVTLTEGLIYSQESQQHP